MYALPDRKFYICLFFDLFINCNEFLNGHVWEIKSLCPSINFSTIYTDPLYTKMMFFQENDERKKLFKGGIKSIGLFFKTDAFKSESKTF